MSTQQSGIFVRSHNDLKKDLRLAGTVDLKQMKVCSGVMLAAVSDKTLLRMSVVSASEKPQELSLPLTSPSDQLAQLHLSPSGVHAIASYKSGENFYIHVKTAAVVALKRIKGTITALGWNHEAQKDTETGAIIFGTAKGNILETLITSGGNVSYLKDHASNFGGDAMPVSDLKLNLLSDDDAKATRWSLLVVFPSRVYPLIGMVDMSPKAGYVGSTHLQTGWTVLPDAASPIFAGFFAVKDPYCLSMHSSSLTGPSALLLHPANDEPTRFAWLGADGYTVGRFDCAAESGRDLLEEEKYIEHRRLEGRVEAPCGISLSEWHVLLAYSGRTSAVSVYTHAVVYEDVFPQELGASVGFTLDASTGTHWMHTNKCTFKYRPNDETRYVWRVLLDRGEYARALTVARQRLAVDPAAHQLVLKRQADKHIAEGNYVAAAEILAQSTESFETLVLKFLSTQDDRRMGLKTLLDRKLDQMRGPEDKMKRDALVLWLLEVQLAELADLRREMGGARGGGAGDEAEKEREREREEKVREMERQIHTFLNRKIVHESVVSNRQAVYRLMVSHADFDSQLYLANSLRDHETCISIYLLREQFKDALQCVIQQSQPDLVYKYAPQLAERVPIELFGQLIGNERIRPGKLLPTLCACMESPPMAAAALKYTEWAVSKPIGAHDQALHNLLIAMYARFKPAKLLEYLKAHGNEKAGIPYDLDFAIRTCEQHALDRCMVHCLCVGEMFTEAVELALKVDVSLAKECACHMSPPEEDDFFPVVDRDREYPVEMRRRVWLKIARHVMERDGDAVACIGLLKESGHVIDMQDILPFFPEFTRIEHLKEPLCACLREHSGKIQDLQQQMREATQIAKEIRERTDKLKKRATVVRVSDVCCRCRKTLCSRPFFAHSCRHLFHRDCLEQAMMAFLDKDTKKRLSELIAKENKILQQIEAEERLGKKTISPEKEAVLSQLSADIGAILGCDCPLCGTIAIDQIDVPLFTDEEYEREQQSWIIN